MQGNIKTLNQNIAQTRSSIANSIAAFYGNYLSDPKLTDLEKMRRINQRLSPREREELMYRNMGESVKQALRDVGATRKDLLLAQIDDTINAYYQSVKPENLSPAARQAFETERDFAGQKTRDAVYYAVDEALRSGRSAASAVNFVANAFNNYGTKLPTLAARYLPQTAENSAGQQKLYRFVTNSENTCNRCSEFAGQVFTMEEAEASDAVPPLHPNCKCRLIEVGSAEDKQLLAERAAKAATKPAPVGMGAMRVMASGAGDRLSAGQASSHMTFQPNPNPTYTLIPPSYDNFKNGFFSQITDPVNNAYSDIRRLIDGTYFKYGPTSSVRAPVSQQNLMFAETEFSKAFGITPAEDRMRYDLGQNLAGLYAAIIASGMAVGSNAGVGTEGKIGTLTGKLDGLTQAERTMVDDLLNQGKNVEIIPRSNLQNIQTPDFKVNGIFTELKSLSGASLNTPVTRITDGFKQGASTVIIDARATGLTVEQANTVINRVNGIYGNNIPGKIEIWTNSGTIYGGK